VCSPPARRKLKSAGPENAGPRRPREVGAVSAVAVFLIVVAATCCGLCLYGISRAVRRAKERQTQKGSVLTDR
jgi:hypothetical protein